MNLLSLRGLPFLQFRLPSRHFSSFSVTGSPKELQASMAVNLFISMRYVIMERRGIPLRHTSSVI